MMTISKPLFRNDGVRNSAVESWKETPAWWIVGALLWVVPILLICLMLGKRSMHHGYHEGMAQWSNEVTPYPALDNEEPAKWGFLYPPSFVPVYWAFDSLPKPFGEVVWRVITGLATGYLLWVLMRRQDRSWQPFDFTLLSLLVLPTSLGALQTGQANSLMAICLFGSAAAIGRRRTFPAACFLAVATAVKPFMIAAVGLALILMPSVVLPFLILVAVLVGLSFLTASHSFVLEQYWYFWLLASGPLANVEQDRFADINGLFREFGFHVSGTLAMWSRLIAGLGLAGWMLRNRTWAAPDDRALLWVCASSAYLMLFNPMNEANSYCMVAVPMALCSWRWIEGGRILIGWAFAACLVWMGVGSELLRPLVPSYVANQFDLRFMPSVTLLFLMSVVWYRVPTSELRITELAERPG